MSSKTRLNGVATTQTGVCIACGTKTEFKCDRCGDSYCSTECQRKDWNSHRYICFPMPKLVKVEDDSAPKKNPPNNTKQNYRKEENVSKTENSLKSANVQKLQDTLPNGSCVHLLNFKSSNRCYIRSTNPSVVEERMKILNKIHEFGSLSAPLTTKPKANSHALALKDDKWCRVQILQNRDKGFLVFYTDFGTRDNKLMADLRTATAEIINLPCHIQMVQLKGITSYSTDHNLVNALNQFANREYKLQYSAPDGYNGNVELFRWGSCDLLNALIEELSGRKKNANAADNKSDVSVNSRVPDTRKPGNSENKAEDKCPSSERNKMNIKNSSKLSEKTNCQPANGVKEKTNSGSLVAKSQSEKETSVPRQLQMQKPCLIPPFEIIPVNISNCNSNFLIMDNSFIESAYVGCLLEKYCENLKAVTTFLNDYKIDDQPYKPKAKEYCLAKFENVWYRARVEEIVSDDKFLVVYIDFTNEKEVSSDSIRRYPMSLDFACCTTLCGIDGLPDDISTELKEFLEEKLKPFSILKIDGIRVQDNICYLTSNELLKSLSDSKLI